MGNDIYTSYDVVNADLSKKERDDDEAEQLSEAYVEYLDECAVAGEEPKSFEEFVKGLEEQAMADKLVAEWEDKQYG